jgi:hypothetical protein
MSMFVIPTYCSPGIGREGLAWFFNQTIGYHTAFSNKITHSVAYQGNIMFFNCGYLYQLDVGSKLYVGVSTFSLPFMFISHVGGLTLDLPLDVRLQYGRVFSNNKNLFRVSFDYFLAQLRAANTNAIHSYSTIGVFVEKKFGRDLPLNGYSFGVSLNWSIWDIFIIKDRNRKYLRKYEN